jgi:hypothetical protein
MKGWNDIERWMRESVRISQTQQNFGTIMPGSEKTLKNTMKAKSRETKQKPSGTKIFVGIWVPRRMKQEAHCHQREC